jgi:hypothetical protein
MMRIIVFSITAGIQIAAAAVGFFVLLLSLNGYSEKQATPSLIFYIVLSLGSVLVAGGTSAYTAKRLTKRKSLGRLGASLIAIIGFSALGVLILIVGFFAALLLAEVVRRVN